MGGILVSYISRESNAVMTSYNWGNVNHNNGGGFGAPPNSTLAVSIEPDPG